MCESGAVLRNCSNPENALAASLVFCLAGLRASPVMDDDSQSVTHFSCVVFLHREEQVGDQTFHLIRSCSQCRIEPDSRRHLRHALVLASWYAV